MDDKIKAGRRMMNKTKRKGIVLICALVVVLLSCFIPNHAAIAGVASCQDLPVRIAGTPPDYFPTLQAAYTEAADGDVIQSLAVTFSENLTLNRNIAVTFDGGYDCGYAAHSGKSALKGQITDNTGKLTIGNFTVVSASPDSTYVITSSAGPGGAISPAGTTSVAQGASQTYMITPDAGFVVAQVIVDGTSVGIVSAYTFTNVTTNHTITASFVANAFTITASAGANGTISPSGIVNVNSGATTTFTITPNTGYHVSDVLVDEVSQGAITSYSFTNVTANHTIAASFAIDTYTITASAGANGTILPSGTVSAISGGTALFTITPDAGYHISDVIVDAVSVGTPTTYQFTNVTANHTITASFALDNTTLSITNVTVDPTAFDLSYGQVMTIKYSLSQQANVTVTLQLAPSAPITLISGVHSAGTHEISEWMGLDSTDPTNKKFVISQDGYYTVKITADSGSSHAEAVVYVLIRR